MKILANSDRIASIELSRRNLEVLLAKLDEDDSQRTLSFYDPEKGHLIVHAVSNEVAYADREPGVMLVNGEFI